MTTYIVNLLWPDSGNEVLVYEPPVESIGEVVQALHVLNLDALARGADPFGPPLPWRIVAVEDDGSERGLNAVEVAAFEARYDQLAAQLGRERFRFMWVGAAESA